MDSTTYNDETVVRSELPLLVAVVYLPRIQILVVGGYPATTLMGRPFGRSGRASKYGSSDCLSMQDRVDRRRADLVSVKSPFPTLIVRKSK